MDCTTCYCRMPRCPRFGQVAPRAQFTWHDWHRQAPRWRCQACHALVSARTGTAYAGIRTESTTYLRGAVALAEGMSIRATGRLLSVDKDTVNHWLPVLGRHCQSVMNYVFRRLHLRECQLDELWTFVAKKEAHLTPLEKLAALYGDAWVWIAFSPVYKLVPAWNVGKRTVRDARQLVLRLQAATDGSIPFFTSDALPHYADALLEVYGVWDTLPRQGTRGSMPQPRRYPPTRLVLRGGRGRTQARSDGSRHHAHRLWNHRAGRSGLAGLACQSHNQHVWRGAQQLDSTPARPADRTEGQCFLERSGLLRVSTDPRVCVLPLRGSTPQSAATPTPPSSNQGPQRIAQDMEACDPSHGG